MDGDGIKADAASEEDGPAGGRHGMPGAPRGPRRRCRPRGSELVAVTDRDHARAEAVAARFGVVAVPDLETGLESGGIDAVVIATPHADHAEAIRLSLEAGKHVLAEKPLTIRADDARSLALLADESRLKLATGLNHRFLPADPRRPEPGRGLVDRPGRERPRRDRPTWPRPSSSSRGIPRSRDPAAGTLMDNGPHACDLIRQFLGEVVLAKGFGPPGRPDAPGSARSRPWPCSGTTTTRWPSFMRAGPCGPAT